MPGRATSSLPASTAIARLGLGVGTPSWLPPQQRWAAAARLSRYFAFSGIAAKQILNGQGVVLVAQMICSQLWRSGREASKRRCF
jgi:hypothetical protein